MFFGTLLFLCCAALLVHNWWLARGIRLLEHQVAWASLDKQAWMRFLLSGQTPVIEPCTGFSKLVEALWAGYISRRVSAQMRTTLESAIAQLPTKFADRIKIGELELGKAAPTALSVTSVCDASQVLTAIDCDIFLENKDMRLALEVATPVGTAYVKVQGMTVRGVIRVIPIPTQNLLAFSFAAPPNIDLNLEVELRGLSKQLGRFGLLKRQMANALYNGLTEPRRRMIPLFPEMSQVFNPRDLAAAKLVVAVTRVQLPVAASVQLVLCAEVRQTSRPFAGGAQQVSNVDGLNFQFALERPAANLLIRLCTIKGTEVARAIVDIKLLRDGTWAMWCLADDGGVQAERWVSGSEPWQVDVPLEMRDEAFKACEDDSLMSTTLAGAQTLSETLQSLWTWPRSKRRMSQTSARSTPRQLESSAASGLLLQQCDDFPGAWSELSTQSASPVCGSPSTDAASALIRACNDVPAGLQSADAATVVAPRHAALPLQSEPHASTGLQSSTKRSSSKDKLLRFCTRKALRVRTSEPPHAGQPVAESSEGSKSHPSPEAREGLCGDSGSCTQQAIPVRKGVHMAPTQAHSGASSDSSVRSPTLDSAIRIGPNSPTRTGRSGHSVCSSSASHASASRGSRLLLRTVRLRRKAAAGGVRKRRSSVAPSIFGRNWHELPRGGSISSSPGPRASAARDDLHAEHATMQRSFVLPAASEQQGWITLRLSVSDVVMMRAPPPPHTESADENAARGAVGLRVQRYCATHSAGLMGGASYEVRVVRGSTTLRTQQVPLSEGGVADFDSVFCLEDAVTSGDCRATFQGSRIVAFRSNRLVGFSRLNLLGIKPGARQQWSMALAGTDAGSLVVEGRAALQQSAADASELVRGLGSTLRMDQFEVRIEHADGVPRAVLLQSGARAFVKLRYSHQSRSTPAVPAVSNPTWQSGAVFKREDGGKLKLSLCMHSALQTTWTVAKCFVPLSTLAPNEIHEIPLQRWNGKVCSVWIRLFVPEGGTTRYAAQTFLDTAADIGASIGF